MTAPRDPDRIIQAFIDEDVAELPARAYDVIRHEIDRTRQRVVMGPLRTPEVSLHGKILTGAVGAVVVVAVAVVVAFELLPVGGPSHGGANPSPSPSLASAPPPSPTSDSAPTARPTPLGQGKLAIEPGPYVLRWPLGPSGARISLTMPDGWWKTGDDATTADGSSIFKGDGSVALPTLGLAAHTVSRIVTSVCPEPSSSEVGPSLIVVGPTVDDLTTALRNVIGTHWSEPEDVTLGGYPAKRLVSTFSAAACPGPVRRWIWIDGRRDAYFVADGVTSTIYVVDVNGDRLVITRDDRAPAPGDVAQLDAIVGSIRIDRGTAAEPGPTLSAAPTRSGVFPVSVGPDADLRQGRHAAVVDGIPFTFQVLAPGWETQLGFYINKSFKGPQGAEAILRWTTFPESANVQWCPGVLSAADGASVARLASAVAAVPGVEVVTSPTDVTVGGHAAKRVVVRVRDVGCDPGFLYTYEPLYGGAMWTQTHAGDNITVWIVEVDGAVLVIEGETVGTAPLANEEMQQVVDSIRFE